MAKYTFTYHQEIGHQGQSLVPHFPGGKSGVTIGPGYDMGHRSPQQIYADLTSAGIDPETAYALIDAANKTGPEAQNWVGQTGGIYITEEQQRSLFENVLVPEYEQRTKEQIAEFVSNHAGTVPGDISWDTLSVRQREILFDYVYNTGSIGRFSEMTTAVLNEDWDTVALHYERFSGDQPLMYRNEMFFREFLDPNHVREDEAENEKNELQLSTQMADAEISELYDEEQTEAGEADNLHANESDEWYERI